MGKIICFSGLKGGSGKTLLSIHFAKFTFCHLKKSVVLVSFDNQLQLTFFGKDAPYPILEGQIKSDLQMNILIEEIKKFDVAIFDIPNQLDMSFLDLYRQADLIALPIEYFEMDYIKILFFIEILQGANVQHNDKLFLIPNKQDRHANAEIKSHFSDNLLKTNIVRITPEIPSSYRLRKMSFTSLTKQDFYLLRPSFQSLKDALYL